MWDVIVIGSGIAGLASAASLARRGRRVLVLEQHSVPGGQTQVFQRERWTFATGVHYIGGVGPQPGAEGQFGRLLHWLGDGALSFAPLANPYDVVRLPGFEFGIPNPESAFREALAARFPGERVAIDRWFEACEEARRAAFTLMALHAMPPVLAFGLRLLRGAHARRWAAHTVADELARVADPQLRAVLGARWGDYGAPPTTAPLVEHAMVLGSYNAGAYYPVGGPGRFAQVLRVPVEQAGGELRTGAEVERILVENGRVAGVVVRQGGRETVETAGDVISAMGVRPTLRCLDPDVGGPWRERIGRHEPGLSYVALYVGLDGDIAAAGATSANTWWYGSEDIGRVWTAPADEDAPGLFVSFPSLKDPGSSGPPTAELLAPLDASAFAPWIDEPDGPRPETYQAFKAWVEERLVGQFDRLFPALRPMRRFHELATPLTQRRFVHADGGAMYGLEMTGERLASDDLKLRTPVPGLLLAGQDVGGPGVQAAFMTGLMAAATLEPALWRQLGA
jgi:all-trans-retinol 13,14-reductase